MEEAQASADFAIAVPAELPSGIQLDHVAEEPSLCPDDQLLIKLVFTGAGNGFMITEVDGGIGFSDRGVPVQINGTEGRIERWSESRGREVVTITWNARGVGFTASALLGEPIAMESDFLEVLESIP